MSKFVIHGSKGSYSFSLHADNGEYALTSESYASKQSAEKGIEAVRVNAERLAAYVHHVSKDGKAYFTMHDSSDANVLGTSETYVTRQRAEEGIAQIMKIAPVATCEAVGWTT